jgi:superfamily I DNA and RNA helicase
MPPEFIWSDSSDTNYAEKVLWDALKQANIIDDGVCYHRYPIFSGDRSRREPDIMLLLRHGGLYVIECKGFKIDNIAQIDGPVWVMQDWHSARENPYTQAEDQMWTIHSKFRNEGQLRKGRHDLIQAHAFIALPFISRAEWREKGLDQSPATPTTIIFADDLAPDKLQARLAEVPAAERQERLTDEQWKLAIGTLRGDPILRREPRPVPETQTTKAYYLHQAEEQIQGIDREQHKIAIQIPHGPQRIRGLAGSGKTVVMCMKAAHMHLRYPEWRIAYTFYTASLRAQIKNLITRFYRWWSDSDPNWNNIQILHGWGGRESAGIYSTAAQVMHRLPRTYSEVKNIGNYQTYNNMLGRCCSELLTSGEEIPQIYDAILIDEAQDFHFDFYKLCYGMLHEPKRLIWAYDEVQSLESLAIPTTIDIFGTHSDGSPVVDLEGTYPDGDVEKDLILYRCYRTPRPLLVTAHVFGMGLLRPNGAVQFIPTSGGWEDIGYEIVTGIFQPGQQVTIRRPEANSPHLLEKLVGYQELVQWQLFNNRNDELAWVAEQIRKNVAEDGLRPEEIAVISLDWKQLDGAFGELDSLLEPYNIHTSRPGLGTVKGMFQKRDHITLTSIFNAKGNEASVVYVVGFEQVERNPYTIIQTRNQAFTAMTRTRGWCVLTGIGQRAERLFAEIAQILADPDKVTFTIPDPATITRNLDNLEYERRRNRVKQANKLASQLARILDEIDDEFLRKQLIEKLSGSLADSTA